MKLNYGIHFNDSVASIARIEAGNPRVVKSDLLKNTTPLAVAFNKKGHVLVGDSAYTNHKVDVLRSKRFNKPINSFIGFNRTLGTNYLYYSSNIAKNFSSEELLGEVFKRLKEYVIDDVVNAVVITVPATFKINQIDSVKKAGGIAGFQQIEIIQEPVAAAIAYGINGTKNDGFWLVFDYQKGTFEAALLKVEKGIIKLIDTEGDNYLGGINLDYAVVDQLIIPNIQGNYKIDGILNDDAKKAEFRGALKFFAEEIKNNLSLNSSHDIYVEPGDIGEDDIGDEIEIDLTVTQDQLKEVLTPVFQKAIDISRQLMLRNNLTGKNLENLILSGIDTVSPILRAMLEKQICKPDISVDPETAMVIGAALHASTVELSEEIKDQTRDKTKIQLEIGHESSTIETEEFVTVKILEDKTDGTFPEKIYAEIKRSDNAWVSGKVVIDKVGEVIEILLTEGKTNIFNVTLYDDQGNLLECEPNSFSIIHGYNLGSPTLPYNIGLEFQDVNSGKVVFRTIPGLEKNKSLPATGTINNLKTERTIRPGMEGDYFELSLFQGEHGAEGSRAIHNHHVNTIYITGSDFPCLLPEGSLIDITISIDKSQKITGKAYFPEIDFECDFLCKTVTDHVETAWLDNEFKKGLSSVNELKRKGFSSDELDKTEKEIKEARTLFESSKDDADTKQQALTRLRRTLIILDNIESGLNDNINSDSSTKKTVEDLLFRLTEEDKIPGDMFGKLYEKLGVCAESSTDLKLLHEELKGYE